VSEFSVRGPSGTPPEIHFKEMPFTNTKEFNKEAAPDIWGSRLLTCPPLPSGGPKTKKRSLIATLYYEKYLTINYFFYYKA
jgi:hypothetical protein